MITDRISSDDPVVALACPRPDFDATVTEFLIGLFSVALAPENENDWARLWRDPPPPEALRAALTTLPDAFALDGDGPRAFQDIDPLEDVEPSPIEALLIDAPGDQTTKFNKDLFFKRECVPVLGRPAAAMALIAMQTFAPSGGQGHRTSMRGGGPLMTIAEPRVRPRKEPLWRLIWANAETVDQMGARDGDAMRDWKSHDRFPWLGKTKTSNAKEQDRPVHPADAAPAQAYFGLPRRIRLEIMGEPCLCPLTGRPDDVCVTGFRMKTYGVQYVGWVHPLTPHYYDKKSGLLPVHGQTGGIGWRDWRSLLFDNANGDGSRPARAVAHFSGERADGPFRMIAAGYDMDNMKARGWVQAELPAFPDHVLARTRSFADRAVEAADMAAGLVMNAVKSGLFQRPKEAKGDFSHLKHSLWANSQAAFFQIIGEIVEGKAPDGPEMREQFRQHLRNAALSIFDLACPLDGLSTGNMRRPIAARHGLVMALEGYGKAGTSLFKALDLATPGSR
jgi:CRISPR system Cascade subunit CasA